MSDIHLYPACAFVRFFENHGLLKLKGRPQWRTVEGGSRAYVEKLTATWAQNARLNSGAVSLRRDGTGVWVRDAQGRTDRYDDVVIATHGDEALAMLEDASPEERELLGAFKYAKNRAVLHTDASFMPRREPLWASWNYVGDNPDGGCVVTYWMNKLQNIESRHGILARHAFSHVIKGFAATLTDAQAAYISVPVDGPYKSAHYRY